MHLPGESTDELFERLYADLRALAGGQLRDERANHTLQPTALVHEVYMRLASVSPGTWEDREKFLALACRAMRRILVDHARAKNRDKRTPPPTVALDAGTLAPQDVAVDLVALDLALRELSSQDADRARMVELHFFGGLTVQETADVLGAGLSTTHRKMRSTKAWLKQRLLNQQGTPPGPSQPA